MNFGFLGKTMVFAGAVFILLGAAFLISGRIPFFGRLPGDILIKRNNFSFYFPLATSIFFSVVISAVLIIINFFRR